MSSIALEEKSNSKKEMTSFLRVDPQILADNPSNIDLLFSLDYVSKYKHIFVGTIKVTPKMYKKFVAQTILTKRIMLIYEQGPEKAVLIPIKNIQMLKLQLSKYFSKLDYEWNVTSSDSSCIIL